MPTIRSDQPLVPSVLDRLLDDDPGVSAEPARNRSQMLRELKMSVRRDIESLLNSRRRNVLLPPGLPELANSLLTYGVPDFSGTGPATDAQRNAFCRMLETVIKQGEPRLLSVSVALAGDPDADDRALKFRIDALLRADPSPEPVVFDSTLEPATHQFAVQGG